MPEGNVQKLGGNARKGAESALREISMSGDEEARKGVFATGSMLSLQLFCGKNLEKSACYH